MAATEVAPKLEQTSQEENAKKTDTSQSKEQSDSTSSRLEGSAGGEAGQEIVIRDDVLARARKRKFTIELSLEEALRMGLENNLNIKMSRLDNDIGRREMVVANAVFDPFFNLGATYAKNRDPSVSFLDADPSRQGVSVSPSERLDYYGSFTGKYVLGTQYELRLSQSLMDRPTVDPRFTFLNPITDTRVTASLRQPLLKGGWYSVNMADVRIAENNSRIAQEDLELTVTDTVFAIEQAYWDLVFSQMNLESKQKALSVTLTNLDNVRKKTRIGTLAAIDVTTAESQVAIRSAELEQAALLVEDNRDRLLQVINYTKDQSLKALWESGSDLEPLDNIGVVCTSVPDTSDVAETRNAALAAAFTNRAEYRKLQLSVDNERVRLEVAKNALLPSLDLVAQWGQLGLQEGYGSSYSELATGRYYDWLAGVEFSIPLSNRGPRNTYRNVRDTFRKVKLQANDLENNIVLEVDGALRKIRSLKRRIADLDERVRLQTELLRAERVRLEVGKSIAYTVSVIENDLVDNLTQALRAKADLQLAKAEYYRATGTLLKRRRITVGPR